MTARLITTLFAAGLAVPAMADCAYVGGTVVNGVCEVPRSAVAQMTPLQQLQAKLYAKRHGIKWRIVNR